MTSKCLKMLWATKGQYLSKPFYSKCARNQKLTFGDTTSEVSSITRISRYVGKKKFWCPLDKHLTFQAEKNTTTRIFIAISLLFQLMSKGYYADNYVKSCVRYVMDHKNFLPTFSANLWQTGRGGSGFGEARLTPKLSSLVNLVYIETASVSLPSMNFHVDPMGCPFSVS